ncbi:MAG: BNR-4 repeat-containing protein [Verrucomicrobiia bacterium]
MERLRKMAQLWESPFLRFRSREMRVGYFFQDMTPRYPSWKNTIYGALMMALSISTLAKDVAPAAVPFGETGKFNMLYDVRQRPQAILLNELVYIVYNGDAEPSKNGNGAARPMLITYNPATRTFSDSVKLDERTNDHHDMPIIWADERDHLHVLYGCHRDPGTYLISKSPVSPEDDTIAWRKGPDIAPGISYPTVFRTFDDGEVLYYRTAGHNSSWTYKISRDNGETWLGPKDDLTDLDLLSFPEWSSYHGKVMSRDGRYLHVGYTDYDDVKSNDPLRLFNPRYGQPVSNEWKYNLSYLKVDLKERIVLNADGEELETPIHLEYSKDHAQIWDTAWRGAGVPPAMALDAEGEPIFLHVLSGDDLASPSYYYLRRENGLWKNTRICFASHQWSSGYLQRDSDGTLHAYVLVWDGYLEGGYMDKHGGGRLEEWVSSNDGDTWTKHRDLSPDPTKYAGWRFNNVQPVVRPNGHPVDGMLIFYGWLDEDLPEAQAFLLHE